MTILRIRAVLFGQNTGKKTGKENRDKRWHPWAEFLDHMGWAKTPIFVACKPLFLQH
jgi:hypothetical protein